MGFRTGSYRDECACACISLSNSAAYAGGRVQDSRLQHGLPCLGLSALTQPGDWNCDITGAVMRRVQLRRHWGNIRPTLLEG